MFSDLFAIIAPVLAITLIGYLWERRGLPFDSQMITPLVIYLSSPCLLLNALLTYRPDLQVMLRIAASAVLLLIITGALAWGVLKAARLPARVFLPAMIFPNAGNMGLPLCLFAFGPQGLTLAVGFFATISVFQFSVGISIASGRMVWRNLFLSPALIAIVIGASMTAVDIAPPRWVTNTLGTLGALTIPLMLLSLGTSLARLQVKKLHRSLGFSAFRLGMGFIVALGICWALGLEGPARGAVLVQASMPSAVFAYLFAARYDNSPDEVAGIVFISTVLSFITLPLLIAYILPH